MARQPKEAYDLSDAEKRDLIQLIQQGKALPEKYRFILFEDKREVELVWNGKSRDDSTRPGAWQGLFVHAQALMDDMCAHIRPDAFWTRAQPGTAGSSALLHRR